ncbi:MAG: alanine--tRNA ligase [Candidatus Berkelbacteria bacterium]|nr:alanine--tRNA ligase [Candidatus Berkelbacteria bacterium]
MNSQDLRGKFLQFFKDKSHSVISSASLVPENDPTVLFTTAGMHPLVPYLMGEKHPAGIRLADAQKCIRTDDIDEVGDKIHHTFFEMLGNWSLGDYFKKEAIEWSFEFLTGKNWLNISIERLAVSVFAGDDDAPFDQESFDLWLKLGISENRIAKLPKKNNWWGPAGETGPCGSDTEMFIWAGSSEAPVNFQESCDDPNWVELWNDVFMQYNKVRIHDPEFSFQYKFEKLTQHNVDTGMGLERTLAVMNGFDDNYRTDLFWPIILEIEKLTSLEYGDKTDEEYIADDKQCWVDVRKQFRIIADHVKAAAFAINDGVLPSNKGAGYIVRRLIRRAVVKGHELKINQNFTAKLAEKVFEIYDGIYFTPLNTRHSEQSEESHRTTGSFAGVQDNRKEMILSELEKEETKFRRTLKDGLKLLSNQKEITGEILFNLYQSFGLPIEIATEEAKNQGIELSNLAIEQFGNLLKAHQELSRTASAGMFKGGLSEAGEITTKYHTATHLLLAALRQVLGGNVFQKGSNITAERMRFDFSYPDKMTAEQLREVKEIVNQKIEEDLPVQLEEMSFDEAKASGAMGVFESKYGDKVKVYSINSFSREMCGGPHVSHTGELGHFKIVKEEASSAGVRRIKAILE